MTQLPHGWVDAAIEDCLCSLDDGRLIHQGWSPQCERVPADDVDAWGVLKTTAIQPGAFIAEENKKLPHAMEPRSGIEVRPGSCSSRVLAPERDVESRVSSATRDRV